ncbi:FixH family protein [Pedobacter kyonggii]|uniref:Nitrogen fixation protein FixH n=1 Tax=Pedobacter kyonggii TaxID=1926871 RepID=A0A4Q9HC25_9SPHI|nr:FixH family protein [Pedobacter kyonggii]TBO41462.1 nitrogen fixation protein FixH [Pedobacter kyonggii]
MNWGTKIVLGMIAFMMFIVGMVVYMFHVHGRDALIEENYYEKGINYNAEYNAKVNVITDNAKPKITITKTQIIIEIKDSATYNLILMRPGNSDDDVKLKGNTSGTANLILVDKTKMGKGVWFLNLQWRSSGKDYLFKNNITL